MFWLLGGTLFLERFSMSIFFVVFFFFFIFCFFNQLPKIPQTTLVLYIYEL